MASGGRQATKPQQQAAEQDLDPKYEWQENAASFVLRLHLSGRDASNLSITLVFSSILKLLFRFCEHARA